MNVNIKSGNPEKRKGVIREDSAKIGENLDSPPGKFSPFWVVLQTKDAPGYKMEVIARISEGVTKDDWKQLIHYKGATEKELENILPSSISSMQKKTVYGKETRNEFTNW